MLESFINFLSNWQTLIGSFIGSSITVLGAFIVTTIELKKRDKEQKKYEIQKLKMAKIDLKVDASKLINSLKQNQRQLQNYADVIAGDIKTYSASENNYMLPTFPKIEILALNDLNYQALRLLHSNYLTNRSAEINKNLNVLTGNMNYLQSHILEIKNSYYQSLKLILIDAGGRVFDSPIEQIKVLKNSVVVNLKGLNLQIKEFNYFIENLIVMLCYIFTYASYYQKGKEIESKQELSEQGFKSLETELIDLMDSRTKKLFDQTNEEIEKLKKELKIND